MKISLSPRNLAVGMIAIGVLLRVREYCLNRALWLDEAMIALNITRRSFAGLLQPLKFNQAAPIGFLWIEKCTAAMLGDTSLGLRLAPLFFGIATVILLVLAARQIEWRSKATPFFAVAMVVLSKPLLRYSNEVKQYSLDSAVACAIVLLSLIVLRSRDARHRLAILLRLVLMAVAPWLSHPAIFVAAGSACALLVNGTKTGDRKTVLMAMLGGLGAAASFLASYWLFDRSAAANAYLKTFWAGQMMPTGSLSAALKWAFFAWRDAADEPFGTTGRWLVIAGVITATVILAGRKRIELLLLFLLPIVLAFAAAMAGKYPFSDRLLCYAIPMAILLLAISFDWLCELLMPWRLLAPIFAVALLAQPSINAISNLIHPRTQEEITQAMAYVQSHRRSGDRIVVLNEARMAFGFYAAQYRLDQPAPWIAISEEGDAGATANDIDRLRPFKKIWIIFSAPGKERLPKEQRVLAALDQAGQRIDEFHAPGASAYRYRLNPQSTPMSASSSTITFVNAGVDPPP